MLKNVPIVLAVAALVAASAPSAAQNAPSTRELERINWMEFQEVVPSKVPTVLLPIGSLEAHGVTVNGTDILAPVAMARDIAARVNAMIAPVVPYGITGSLDAYPGGLTMPDEASTGATCGRCSSAWRATSSGTSSCSTATAATPPPSTRWPPRWRPRRACERWSSTGGPSARTSPSRCSARTAATPARTRTPT